MSETVALHLLNWYDCHARRLPWRAQTGEIADPYRVWLSEIMLQQTTVAAVIPYFHDFTTRWPELQALASADPDLVMQRWAGLGYYARARNLLACAREVIARFGGQFPQAEADLLSLPGIGAYTAAAIRAIAFDQPATVVDGNVERVVARLFAIEQPLPAAKPALRHAATTLTPQFRCGDFAQAMMDLGATICVPATPRCDMCPLSTQCQAKALGIAHRLPAKAEKQPRPIRQGTAWWLISGNGTVLLHRRPASGLLGGMHALPSSGWDGSADAPPMATEWQTLPGEVRHVFTHFEARIRVLTGHCTSEQPQLGEWWRVDDLDQAALPSLMIKVVKHVLSHTGTSVSMLDQPVRTGR